MNRCSVISLSSIDLVQCYRWHFIQIEKETEIKFYRIPRNILIDYLKTEGITYEIPPENCHTLRYKIWHFLEVPKVKYFVFLIGGATAHSIIWIKSSRAARMLHYFNTILILVSVFIFCVETLPVLRPRSVFISILAFLFADGSRLSDWLFKIKTYKSCSKKTCEHWSQKFTNQHFAQDIT